MEEIHSGEFWNNFFPLLVFKMEKNPNPKSTNKLPGASSLS